MDRLRYNQVEAIIRSKKLYIDFYQNLWVSRYLFVLFKAHYESFSSEIKNDAQRFLTKLDTSCPLKSIWPFWNAKMLDMNADIFTFVFQLLGCVFVVVVVVVAVCCLLLACRFQYYNTGSIICLAPTPRRKSHTRHQLGPSFAWKP